MFCRNLEYYRKRANLSQTELAERCGVSQQVVNAYELGSRKPSIEVLVLIAKALGCTTDQLLCSDVTSSVT